MSQALFDSSKVPEILQKQAQLLFDHFADRLGEEGQAQLHRHVANIEGLELETFADQLSRVFACSEYVAQTLTRLPDILESLLETGNLYQPLQGGYDDFLSQARDCSDDKALDSLLRRRRQREMVRIIWRDLTRMASLDETTTELSSFADAAIQAAMDWHYQKMVAIYGHPIGKFSGAKQPMVVLGMGKLGARELNVSSDIDLIFAYPESGSTNGEKRQLDNQEFFVRLGQKVIKSLDAVTAEGFVFRVDMRLRPYGQSGALVMNYPSLEDYYQTQGREWERYAMIKARPVAYNLPEQEGDSAATELMAMLRPFTYRLYIDYTAIDSLRQMKELIAREVSRKGIATDVKLGIGGIREVEFIVQVFQLIRAGREPELRERRVVKLLALLQDAGYLPEQCCRDLAAAYEFLRNTEHAIQGYQDKQTQAMPVDERDSERLAFAMGYESFSAFDAALQSHRDKVHGEFAQVISDPETPEDEQAYVCDEWCALWNDALSEEDAEKLLKDQGFSDLARVQKALQSIRDSRSVVAMQASSRDRLDMFMGKLLPALEYSREHEVEPEEALERIVALIEAIARRSVYLVLLNENPIALKQLVKLSSASTYIGDQLAKHPALLDELLSPQTLYSPPDINELRDELRQSVLRIGWEDLESHMETLRYFKMAHSLRVAASEVAGTLPIMKVSDYLTWIAEVILEHVLALAWEQLVAKHGRPMNADGSACESDFIIVGYGKMGGIELGHGSDLDLVFIHNADINKYTDGERSIDNQTFFTRLGQKIIHILNSQTLSGQLYEVDMRLRPSGNSGLLVASIAGFEKYQDNEAWTWEHQALVRARAVAGCKELAEQFNQVRCKTLKRARDLPKLKADVVEMREKMRGHLGSGVAREAVDFTPDQEFHLKQDAGAIVDIEFMVQYAVLAWAQKAPELADWTDNIRILETLANTGLMQAESVERLTEAYKAYRSAGHRLALQRRSSLLGGDRFVDERKAVMTLWDELLTSN